MLIMTESIAIAGRDRTVGTPPQGGGGIGSDIANRTLCAKDVISKLLFSLHSHFVRLQHSANNIVHCSEKLGKQKLRK